MLPGGVVAGGWQAEGALLLLDQSAARGQSRLQRLWHVSCVTPSLLCSLLVTKVIITDINFKSNISIKMLLLNNRV